MNFLRRCLYRLVYYFILQIYKTLKKRLGYSLKEISEIVIQRNDKIKQKYTSSVNLLVRHPKQCIFIDEAAKGRNTSRRNKAWGRVGENFELERWFRDDYNYTLVAACNSKGFIPSAIIMYQE